MPHQDRSGYDPPRLIKRLPSWLANEVAKKADGLVSQAFTREGVRRHHFAVMGALAERGAASQAALGRRLLIDPSDMHAILGELEEPGLVRRVQDQRDRRRNLVELTPAGARRLRALDASAMAAQEQLLAGLTKAERKELKRLLEAVLVAPQDRADNDDR